MCRCTGHRDIGWRKYTKAVLWGLPESLEEGLHFLENSGKLLKIIVLPDRL